MLNRDLNLIIKCSLGTTVVPWRVVGAGGTKTNLANKFIFSPNLAKPKYLLGHPGRFRGGGGTMSREYPMSLGYRDPPPPNLGGAESKKSVRIK